MASSLTQLPKLETSKSFLGSHVSLYPHIQCAPAPAHSTLQGALDSTRPLWTHGTVPGQTPQLPACPLAASASPTFSLPSAPLLSVYSKTTVLTMSVCCFKCASGPPLCRRQISKLPCGLQGHSTLALALPPGSPPRAAHSVPPGYQPTRIAHMLCSLSCTAKVPRPPTYPRAPSGCSSLPGTMVMKRTHA